MSEVDQDQQKLEAELQSWIGESLTGGVRQAQVPVNVPMIQQWNDAFVDRNPVYEDAVYAESTRFGGLIAPPAMMQTWCMPRPQIVGIGERGGAPEETDRDSPLLVLDAAGFTGILATNSELEFNRPLRPGDLLTSDVVLENISGRKKTGLGQGYFVTWVQKFVDQHGEEVGFQRFSVLKFNPSTIGQ